MLQTGGFIPHTMSVGNPPIWGDATNASDDLAILHDVVMTWFMLDILNFRLHV
jgi:hypothetical protein